ncbi:hypothetical protein AVO45_09035 [Ruegeria marisrubri]|uniref:Translocase n=1 Tax=Ruegeria marisrubri TaxID=1685379 RepID=A0A0X3TQR7_9RHOB|nr:hypothetical protein [Ruegeria marisrubri]KUJ78092.1 hypothetical protein AVO45_09035 [Ruegeria marisrubri]
MALFGNFVTIGGTLCCALSTGYLVQNGLAAPTDPDAVAERVASAPLRVADVEVAVLPELRNIALTSVTPREGGKAPPAKTPTRVAPELPGPAGRTDCKVAATATAAPMASVDLSVSAPCHGNQRVTVHHSGLSFTETTGPDGRLDVTIPALAENAVFVVALDDRHGAVASARVNDLGGYDRIALQWAGKAGFQIHALEFGASYGQAGHVWADPAARGQGTVTHLGKAGFPEAQVVEIYSFPSDAARRSGTIALSLEAEVTDDNCGREFSAQSFELRANLALRFRELSLKMPDCGATGEFLVLDNLLEDLKIAAR